MIEVHDYEGGIRSGTRLVPAPSAALTRWLDEHAMELCSCRGEAHDECAEEDE